MGIIDYPLGLVSIYYKRKKMIKQILLILKQNGLVDLVRIVMSQDKTIANLRVEIGEFQMDEKEFLETLEKLIQETLEAVPLHEFMIPPIKKIQQHIAMYKAERKRILDLAMKWEPEK